MASKRDKALRSVLKQAGLPKPPAQFTPEVMREIEAMAGKEVYTNPILKRALQRHGHVTPAANFTYKVLNKTRHRLPDPTYPPVIGKKIWVAMGVFVFFYVVAAIVIGLGDRVPTGLPYTPPLASVIRLLPANFRESLSYLGLITFTACLLLTLDYHFVKKRRRPGRVA
jgi:hypothetical protein